MAIGSVPLRSLLTRRKWQRSVLTLTLLWCLVWLLTSTNLVARAPPVSHGYDVPGSVEGDDKTGDEIPRGDKAGDEIQQGDKTGDERGDRIGDEIPGGFHNNGLSEDHGGQKPNDQSASREMGGKSGENHKLGELNINDLIRSRHGDNSRNMATYVKYHIEQKPNVTDSHKIDPYSQPAKYNIAYIKMIKCASETMTLLLYRFGYMRDLSFMLPPPHKLYLGWPYQLQEGFYRPTRDGRFHILCDHAVYNVDRFSALMPSDTAYITSIREPFAQVRSMFNYYNLAKIVGLTKEDPNAFREYLSHLEHYESIYKSSEANITRFCIPDGFSMTKNLMSFNLGFPTGWDGTVDESNNSTVIQQWLAHISNQFDLVMIVEYFVESLILLKRQLKWTWKDILHTVQNVGYYNKTNLYRDRTLIDMYKQWSRVDYILYDHFNKTLWDKISVEGNDFKEEVAAFKDTLSITQNFCAAIPDSAPADGSSTSRDSVLHVGTSRWDSGFQVDSVDCTLLQYDHMKFMNQISLQYMKRHAGVVFKEKPPPKYVC